MAELLKLIKELEREEFFRRLDYQWGKALPHVKTRPSRCPDFRVITKPPTMQQYSVQWRKTAHSDWVTVYSNIWRRQCIAWIEAQRVQWPQVRLRLTDRSI